MELRKRNSVADALKSFGIIAVVLYHLGFLEMGFLGVDIFLVIAGFFGAKSIYKKYEKGEFNYIDYIIGKLVRLWPLLLIGSALCLLLGCINMLPDNLENLSETVVATNLFANNILQCITTGNYWDVVNNYKPLMHTWYVGVLMQFYVVLPVLFAVVGKKGNSKKKSCLLISAFTLVSLLLYLFYSCNSTEKFYYLPFRFFEFGIGCIISLYTQELASKIEKLGKTTRTAVFYLSLVLLILLISVPLPQSLLSSSLRLILVVVLSTLTLVLSLLPIEDKFAANILSSKFFTSFGKASYSIFVWHQIIIAFIRCFVTSEMSVGIILFYIAVVALLCIPSYIYVENKLVAFMTSKAKKAFVYSATILLFVITTAVSLGIYMNAGVIRDVPELDIYMSNVKRGLHSEYNSRVYDYNKDFSDNEKEKWLILGDSFARDWANIVLETSYLDDVVEFSYSSSFSEEKIIERIKNSDCVFIAEYVLNEKHIDSIRQLLSENNSTVKLWIIGSKNFGESNDIFYAKRNSADYFDSRVDIDKKILSQNNVNANQYGDEFIDIISYVIDDDQTVPVFTPDNKYISQDCRHLTRSGAVYFSSLIDMRSFLNDN